MIRIEPARPELLQPEQPGQHVWVVIGAFLTSDAELRRTMADGSDLDLLTERLAWAEVGCIACQAGWTAELSGTPCEARTG